MNVKNSIPIVVDVNLWISYLIGKGIKQRFENLLNDTRFEIEVREKSAHINRTIVFLILK